MDVLLGFFTFVGFCTVLAGIGIGLLWLVELVLGGIQLLAEAAKRR